MWISQFCFSLGFLSQNSLWKFSTFHGYKGIYSSVCKEWEKSIFIQTGYSGDSILWLEWVASLSRELIVWPDCIFCLVVLQLSWSFSSLHTLHVCHFGNLPVMSQSRDPIVRLLLSTHNLSFFTLSYTHLLHYSHLNTRYLIAKIQTNLARNKDNTWLNKFNLTKII